MIGDLQLTDINLNIWIDATEKRSITLYTT